MATTTVTLTCPVCGLTEEAIGYESMSSSYFNGALTTSLNYTASVQHDCPGITVPPPP
jgi:hypothetical protein